MTQYAKGKAEFEVKVTDDISSGIIAKLQQIDSLLEKIKANNNLSLKVDGSQIKATAQAAGNNFVKQMGKTYTQVQKAATQSITQGTDQGIKQSVKLLGNSQVAQTLETRQGRAAVTVQNLKSDKNRYTPDWKKIESALTERKKTATSETDREKEVSGTKQPVVPKTATSKDGKEITKGLKEIAQSVDSSSSSNTEQKSKVKQESLLDNTKVQEAEAGLNKFIESFKGSVNKSIRNLKKAEEKGDEDAEYLYSKKLEELGHIGRKIKESPEFSTVTQKKSFENLLGKLDNYFGADDRASDFQKELYENSAQRKSVSQLETKMQSAVVKAMDAGFGKQTGTTGTGADKKSQYPLDIQFFADKATKKTSSTSPAAAKAESAKLASLQQQALEPTVKWLNKDIQEYERAVKRYEKNPTNGNSGLLYNAATLLNDQVLTANKYQNDPRYKGLNLGEALVEIDGKTIPFSKIQSNKTVQDAFKYLQGLPRDEGFYHESKPDVFDTEERHYKYKSRYSAQNKALKSAAAQISEETETTASSVADNFKIVTNGIDDSLTELTSYQKKALGKSLQAAVNTTKSVIESGSRYALGEDANEFKHSQYGFSPSFGLLSKALNADSLFTNLEYFASHSTIPGLDKMKFSFEFLTGLEELSGLNLSSFTGTIGEFVNKYRPFTQSLISSLHKSPSHKNVTTDKVMNSSAALSSWEKFDEDAYYVTNEAFKKDESLSTILSNLGYDVSGSPKLSHSLENTSGGQKFADKISSYKDIFSNSPTWFREKAWDSYQNILLEADNSLDRSLKKFAQDKYGYTGRTRRSQSANKQVAPASIEDQYFSAKELVADLEATIEGQRRSIVPGLADKTYKSSWVRARIDGDGKVEGTAEDIKNSKVYMDAVSVIQEVESNPKKYANVLSEWNSVEQDRVNASNKILGNFQRYNDEYKDIADKEYENAVKGANKGGTQIEAAVKRQSGIPQENKSPKKDVYKDLEYYHKDSEGNITKPWYGMYPDGKFANRFWSPILEKEYAIGEADWQRFLKDAQQYEEDKAAWHAANKKARKERLEAQYEDKSDKSDSGSGTKQENKKQIPADADTKGNLTNTLKTDAQKTVNGLVENFNSQLDQSIKEFGSLYGKYLETGKITPDLKKNTKYLYDLGTGMNEYVDYLHKYGDTSFLPFNDELLAAQARGKSIVTNADFLELYGKIGGTRGYNKFLEDKLISRNDFFTSDANQIIKEILSNKLESTASAKKFNEKIGTVDQILADKNIDWMDGRTFSRDKYQEKYGDNFREALGDQAEKFLEKYYGTSLTDEFFTDEDTGAVSKEYSLAEKYKEAKQFLADTDSVLKEIENSPIPDLENIELSLREGKEDLFGKNYSLKNIKDSTAYKLAQDIVNQVENDPANKAIADNWKSSQSRENIIKENFDAINGNFVDLVEQQRKKIIESDMYGENAVDEAYKRMVNGRKKQSPKKKDTETSYEEYAERQQKIADNRDARAEEREKETEALNQEKEKLSEPEKIDIDSSSVDEATQKLKEAADAKDKLGESVDSGSQEKSDFIKTAGEPSEIQSLPKTEQYLSDLKKQWDLYNDEYYKELNKYQDAVANGGDEDASVTSKLKNLVENRKAVAKNIKDIGKDFNRGGIETDMSQLQGYDDLLKEVERFENSADLKKILSSVAKNNYSKSRYSKDSEVPDSALGYFEEYEALKKENYARHQEAQSQPDPIHVEVQDNATPALEQIEAEKEKLSTPVEIPVEVNETPVEQGEQKPAADSKTPPVIETPEVIPEKDKNAEIKVDADTSAADSKIDETRSKAEQPIEQKVEVVEDTSSSKKPSLNREASYDISSRNEKYLKSLDSEQETPVKKTTEVETKSTGKTDTEISQEAVALDDIAGSYLAEINVTNVGKTLAEIQEELNTLKEFPSEKSVQLKFDFNLDQQLLQLETKIQQIATSMADNFNYSIQNGVSQGIEFAATQGARIGKDNAEKNAGEEDAPKKIPSSKGSDVETPENTGTDDARIASLQAEIDALNTKIATLIANNNALHDELAGVKKLGGSKDPDDVIDGDYKETPVKKGEKSSKKKDTRDASDINYLSSDNDDIAVSEITKATSAQLKRAWNDVFKKAYPDLVADSFEIGRAKTEDQEAYPTTGTIRNKKKNNKSVNVEIDPNGGDLTSEFKFTTKSGESVTVSGLVGENYDFLAASAAKTLGKSKIGMVDVGDVLNNLFQGLYDAENQYASLKRASEKGIVKNPEKVASALENLTSYQNALADYEDVFVDRNVRGSYNNFKKNGKSNFLSIKEIEDYEAQGSRIIEAAENLKSRNGAAYQSKDIGIYANQTIDRFEKANEIITAAQELTKSISSGELSGSELKAKTTELKNLERDIKQYTDYDLKAKKNYGEVISQFGVGDTENNKKIYQSIKNMAETNAYDQSYFEALEKAAASKFSARNGISDLSFDKYDYSKGTVNATYTKGGKKFNSTLSMKAAEDADNGEVVNFVAQNTRALNQKSALQGWMDNFTTKMRSMATYLSSMIILQKVLSEFQKGVSFIENMDSALTNIGMTMSASEQQLHDLGQSAVQTGIDYGTSAENVLSAMSIYANANETADSIAEKSKPTVMLANAAKTDTATSADQIQGVVNQFGLSGQENRIVNSYEKISAGLALDFAEGINTMSEAVSGAGSIAKESGLELEQFMAMAGVISEQTRLSGSTVGTQLRSMMARMSRSKSADEDVTASDRSQAAKAYKAVGIDLYDRNGEYRDLGDTLDELAGKWRGMTDAERNYIAEQSAGTRGINVFNTLMDQWSKIQELAGSALTDTDFALQNQERYANSIEGSKGRLEASMQGFWNNVISTSALSQIMDLGSLLVSGFTGITGVVDQIGNILTPIPGIGSTAATGLTGLATLATGFSAIDFFKQLTNGKTWQDIIGGETKLSDVARNSFAAFVNPVQALWGLSRDTFQGNIFKGIKNNRSFLNSALTDAEKTLFTADELKNVEKIGDLSAANRKVVEDLRNENLDEADRTNKYYSNLGRSLADTDWNKVRTGFSSGLKKGFNKVFGSKNIEEEARLAIEANNKTYEAALSQGGIASMGAKLGSFLGTWGIPILAAGLAYAGYQSVSGARDAVAERATSARSEFAKNNQQLKQNQSFFDSISSEYAELVKGVNTFTNENVSLTNSEYQKYLDLTNQIASTFPALVSGFDSTGNAILNTRNALSSMNQAMEQQTLQNAVSNMGNAKDLINDFRFNWDSTFHGDDDLWQKMATWVDSGIKNVRDTFTEGGQIADFDRLTADWSTYGQFKAYKEFLDSFTTDQKLDQYSLEAILGRNSAQFADKFGLANNFGWTYTSSLENNAELLGKVQAEYATVLGNSYESLQGVKTVLDSQLEISRIIDDVDTSNISKRDWTNLQAMFDATSFEQMVGIMDATENNPRQYAAQWVSALQQAGKDSNLSNALDKILSINDKSTFSEIRDVIENSFGYTLAGIQDKIDGLNLNQLKDSLGFKEADQMIKAFDDVDRTLSKVSHSTKQASKETQNLGKTADQAGNNLVSGGQKLLDFINKMGINTKEEMELLRGLINEADNLNSLSWDDLARKFDVTSFNFDTISQELESLEGNIDSASTKLSNLFSAKSEANGMTGATMATIKALDDEFSQLEGYDYDWLFENTTNGVHINPKAFDTYKKQLTDLELAKYSDEAAQLQRQLASVLQTMAQTTDKNELASLGMKRDQLVESIDQLNTLQSAAEAVFSPLNQLQLALSSANYSDNYDSLAGLVALADDGTASGSIAKLYEMGRVGTDDFKAFAQLLTDTDLTGESAKKYVEVYEANIGRYRELFTDDNSGIRNGMALLAQAGLYYQDAETGAMKMTGTIDEMAAALGTSLPIAQLFFDELRDYGWEAPLMDAPDYISDLRKEAVKAKDELAGTDWADSIDLSNLSTENIDNIISKLEEVKEQAGASGQWQALYDFATAFKGLNMEVGLSFETSEGRAELEEMASYLEDNYDIKVNIDWSSNNPREIKNQIDEFVSSLDQFRDKDGKITSAGVGQETYDALYKTLNNAYLKQNALAFDNITSFDTNLIDVSTQTGQNIQQTALDIQSLAAAVGEYNSLSRMQDLGFDISNAQIETAAQSVKTLTEGMNSVFSNAFQKQFDIDFSSMNPEEIVGFWQDTLPTLTMDILTQGDYTTVDEFVAGAEGRKIEIPVEITGDAAKDLDFIKEGYMKLLPGERNKYGLEIDEESTRKDVADALAQLSNEEIESLMDSISAAMKVELNQDDKARVISELEEIANGEYTATVNAQVNAGTEGSSKSTGGNKDNNQTPKASDNPLVQGVVDLFASKNQKTKPDKHNINADNTASGSVFEGRDEIESFTEGLNETNYQLKKTNEYYARRAERAKNTGTSEEYLKSLEEYSYQDYLNSRVPGKQTGKSANLGLDHNPDSKANKYSQEDRNRLEEEWYQTRAKELGVTEEYIRSIEKAPIPQLNEAAKLGLYSEQETLQDASRVSTTGRPEEYERSLIRQSKEADNLAEALGRIPDQWSQIDGWTQSQLNDLLDGYDLNTAIQETDTFMEAYGSMSDALKERLAFTLNNGDIEASTQALRDWAKAYEQYEWKVNKGKEPKAPSEAQVSAADRKNARTGANGTSLDYEEQLESFTELQKKEAERNRANRAKQNDERTASTGANGASIEYQRELQALNELNERQTAQKDAAQSVIDAWNSMPAQYAQAYEKVFDINAIKSFDSLGKAWQNLSNESKENLLFKLDFNVADIPDIINNLDALYNNKEMTGSADSMKKFRQTAEDVYDIYDNLDAVAKKDLRVKYGIEVDGLEDFDGLLENWENFELDEKRQFLIDMGVNNEDLLNTVNLLDQALQKKKELEEERKRPMQNDAPANKDFRELDSQSNPNAEAGKKALAEMTQAYMKLDKYNKETIAQIEGIDVSPEKVGMTELLDAYEKMGSQDQKRLFVTSLGVDPTNMDTVITELDAYLSQEHQLKLSVAAESGLNTEVIESLGMTNKEIDVLIKYTQSGDFSALTESEKENVVTYKVGGNFELNKEEAQFALENNIIDVPAQISLDEIDLSELDGLNAEQIRQKIKEVLDGKGSLNVGDILGIGVHAAEIDPSSIVNYSQQWDQLKAKIGSDQIRASITVDAWNAINQAESFNEAWSQIDDGTKEVILKATGTGQENIQRLKAQIDELVASGHSVSIDPTGGVMVDGTEAPVINGEIMYEPDMSAAEGATAPTITGEINYNVNQPEGIVNLVSLGLENLTAGANANVTYGVNSDAPDSYQPADKEATATYNLNSAAVDGWVPPQKTGNATYNARLGDTSALDNIAPRTVTVNVQVGGNASAVGSAIQSAANRMASRMTANNAKNGDSAPSLQRFRTFARGTAFARGTVDQEGEANANGTWGIPHSITSLVGELGQELVVRGSKWFTVGDQGPEMRQLKRGDIVFNHKQTKDILNKGHTHNRGSVVGGNNAFAQGSAFYGGNNSFDGDIWLGGGITQTPLNPNSHSVGGANQWADAANNLNQASSSLENAAEQIASAVDDNLTWIERLEKRFASSLKALEQIFDNEFLNYSERIDARSEYWNEIERQLESYGSMWRYYMGKADAVGLPADIVDKIKNGSLDVTGAAAYESQIEEYIKWYDMAMDAHETADELRVKQRQAVRDNFDLRIDEYNKWLEAIGNSMDILDNKMALVETKGHFAGERYFELALVGAEAQVDSVEESWTRIAEAYKIAINEVPLGSQAAREMALAVQEQALKWYDAKKALYQYQQQLYEARAVLFDYKQDILKDVHDENEFLRGLISVQEDDMFSKRIGRLNAFGFAYGALHAEDYELYMRQAQDIKQEIDDIEAKLMDDPYNDKLTNKDLLDRRRELVASYQEMITAANDEKKAVQDLVENQYNRMLQAIQKLIDKRKEQLRAEKDLYDYERNVTDQVENLTDLYKQLNALHNDHSEEARLRKSQIREQIKDSERNLEETEYSRWISDQEELMDKFYKFAEDVFDRKLHHIDEHLQNMIDYANANLEQMTCLVDMARDSGRLIEEADKDGKNYTQKVLEEMEEKYGYEVQKANEYLWKQEEVLVDLKDVLDFGFAGLQDTVTKIYEWIHENLIQNNPEWMAPIEDHDALDNSTVIPEPTKYDNGIFNGTYGSGNGNFDPDKYQHPPDYDDRFEGNDGTGTGDHDNNNNLSLTAINEVQRLLSSTPELLSKVQPILMEGFTKESGYQMARSLQETQNIATTSLSTQSGGNTVNVQIDVQTVQNAEEFVKQLANDSKFRSLVSDISGDAAAGRSKYNYRRGK